MDKKTTVETLLALAGFLMSYLMYDAVGELKQLRSSVTTLNVNVAVLLEKMDGHERRISNLENQ